MLYSPISHYVDRLDASRRSNLDCSSADTRGSSVLHNYVTSLEVHEVREHAVGRARVHHQCRAVRDRKVARDRVPGVRGRDDVGGPRSEPWDDGNDPGSGYVWGRGAGSHDHTDTLAAASEGSSYLDAVRAFNLVAGE